MLDYRIDTFLTLCEVKNYTKTAQIMNMTQPAVTQHIHYLENYYECHLFCFEGAKLLLTPQGQRVRTYLLTKRSDEEKLKQELCDEKPKKLAFGATLTLGEFIIPTILKSYLLKHPDILLCMEVDNTKSLLEKLKHGEIYFAFVEGTFSLEEYESLVFLQDEIVGISAKNSNLRALCTADELFEYPLLLREKGSGTRAVLEQYLNLNAISISEFSSVHEIGNVNAIKALVQANVGISFVYHSAVALQLISALKEFRIQGIHMYHDYRFVCLKDSQFIEEFKGVLKEFIEIYIDENKMEK